MVVGKQNKKLSVYYDGKCRVCSAEISHYIQKDKKKNICFVDISDENFVPEEHGLENCDIHVNLHVKFVDGRICSGVDAFIAIWEYIPGFSILAKISRHRLVKPLARFGYHLFTRIRPYLPRKKSKRVQNLLCSSGMCSQREQ